MSQMNDIALVAQVVVFKNKRAYDTLVRKYQSSVRRFFLHQTLGNTSLSDDLSQETFIKAYTSLSTFKGMANFQTWLYRIAYNVFYDYIRTQKEVSELDPVQADNILNTGYTPAGEKMDIYKGLAQLKENERTCIMLFYIEDQPIEKIAKITGFPVGTVKSHLSRGREKLANFLKENGYD